MESGSKIISANVSTEPSCELAASSSQNHCYRRPLSLLWYCETIVQDHWKIYLFILLEMNAKSVL